MVIIRAVSVATLLVLAVPLYGQVDRRAHPPTGASVDARPAGVKRAAPVTAGTVFVGRVLGPDGDPAGAAIVVTSAGGQAVTDTDGSFSLEVELPVDTETVRVTAVMGSGTGSLVASMQVGGLSLWGTTSAGTFALKESTTCQPSWLPVIEGDAGLNAMPFT
jgi:hypothetical protein